MYEMIRIGTSYASGAISISRATDAGTHTHTRIAQTIIIKSSRKPGTLFTFAPEDETEMREIKARVRPLTIHR